MKTLMHDTLGNAILCAGLLLNLAACDGTDRTSPTAPSSPARVVVRGYVMDSAHRPVDGARIEVVNGPEAGLSTIAGSNGRYALGGSFDAATELRATKDGHITGSRVSTLQGTTPFPRPASV